MLRTNEIKFPQAARAPMWRSPVGVLPAASRCAVGDVGQHTSITIGADGLPMIAYHDATNGDLKVAKCANAFCAPYFRRR